MLKKDIILETIKNVKKSPVKSILFIIFLGFMLLLGNILIHAIYTSYIFETDYPEKDISSNTLLVYKKGYDYSQTIDEVSKIPHVVNIYNTSYNATNGFIKISENEKISTLFKPIINDEFPKIIKGRNVENNDEILCPINFAKIPHPYNKDDLQSMELMLGKKVDIYYNKVEYVDLQTQIIVETFNQKFKIVGLYQNILSTSTYNECYFTDETLRKIVVEREPITSEKFDQQAVIEKGNRYTHIIVDYSANLPKVKQELQKRDYDIMDGQDLNVDALIKLILTFSISIIVLSILIIVTFVIYTNVMIKDRRTEIGLYKTFGYKNKDITNLIVVQMLIYTIVSYIIGLIILFLGMYIINIQISNNLSYYTFFEIKFSILGETIYILFLILIIFTISNITSRKICRLEAKDIINENSF